MNFLDPEYKSLTSDQLLMIDQICGDYEQRRMDGLETRIEDLVAAAPEALRAVLELELIKIELEIAASWHQLPKLEDLTRRFPRSAEIIQREWRLWTRENSATASDELNAKRRETRNANDQPTPVVGPADSKTASSPDHEDSSNPNLRFHIVRRIAEGGIGTVYAAFDKDLQREVALKELKGSLVQKSSVVNRFLIEATVTSHLEHPNIVPIYAVGRRSDGRHFYAMRFIRGQSMQAAIFNLHRQASKFAGGAIDFRRIPEARDLLQRFVAVCRAIGFAHSRGVIHRDLKPANIMVGDFGETLVVDWGLARRRVASSPTIVDRESRTLQSSGAGSTNALNRAKSSVIGSVGLSHHGDTFISDIDGDQHDANGDTRAGTIVGTPGYMSPEQAAGQVELMNETSDIYSLGATLFCLLTNSVPIMHTGTASHQIQSEAAAKSKGQIHQQTRRSFALSTAKMPRNSLPRDGLSLAFRSRWMRFAGEPWRRSNAIGIKRPKRWLGTLKLGWLTNRSVFCQNPLCKRLAAGCANGHCSSEALQEVWSLRRLRWLSLCKSCPVRTRL